MFNQLKMKTMTKMKIWMPAILCISYFVVSCQKEEPVVEAEVLAEYLESVDSPAKNYVNTDMPAIRSAEQAKTLNTLNKV
jgi:hypothetical protein